jgi:toxin ParE1/3/4
MGTVYRRAAARADLIAHYVYLASQAGETVADRFLTNAETSFNDLAERPMIGSPLERSNPALLGMRKWRVNGFDNYLIFYLPRADGVSIVRVLHGARDWWRLLGLENERT